MEYWEDVNNKANIFDGDKEFAEKPYSTPLGPGMQYAENYEPNAETDKVNHPSHYCQGGIEVIDIIESAVTGLEPFEAVCAGNAIKYLCRWKHKNGVEDLQKAVWYINKLIEHNSGE